MDIIEREIIDTDNDEYDFFNIIKIGEKNPIFSNDILDFWSPLGNLNGYLDGYEVGVCRIKKRFDYFTRMEAHKNTQEILIPIDFEMFVPIAPPGLQPDIEKVILPRVKIGEIIVINEGVWHFAAGPIDSAKLSYFVLLKKGTPKNDLVMKDLNVRVNINFK